MAAKIDPKKFTPSAMSIFDDVKMNAVPSPPLIVIYGSPGIGKTAFGIGAGPDSDYTVGRPEHLLLNIDFRGADRLKCRRATDLIKKPFEGMADIMSVFTMLKDNDHPFKWLVIDDLSSLEEIFVTEICKQHSVNNLAKVEYGKGYELARMKWMEFFGNIKWFQDNSKPIGIIMIGHSKVDQQKDPLSESYSRHDLQLDKRSKELIKKAVDVIGFVRVKTRTKQVESEFGHKENVAVGNSERIITFAPDIAGFESKDRLKLPDELPLDWSIFECELIKSLEA